MPSGLSTAKPITDLDFLTERLARLAEDGLLRTLQTAESGIDFWSNDYLGLARDLRVDPAAHGATGSRLISGNYPALGELEKKIATHHRFPAARFFASGYLANLGLLSALSRRVDTVFYDELIHASLRDGIRLGQGRSYRFAHNDVAELAELLDKARPDGQAFVVTESRFSMDGDLGPIRELAEVCHRAGAHLIVDEAHASGLAGPLGGGWVAKLGLRDQVLATVVTHGKAFGAHGAAVLGARAMVDYLAATARPFIYSTAPPPAQVAAVSTAYDSLRAEHETRYARLRQLIESFHYMVAAYDLSGHVPKNSGPIQIFRLPGNAAVLEAEAACRETGFLIKGIRSPTVAAGTERLRICLHAFNDEAEVVSLLAVLRGFV